MCQCANGKNNMEGPEFQELPMIPCNLHAQADVLSGIKHL